MLDGGHVQSFPLLPAQDFQLYDLVQTVQIECGRKRRQRFNAAVVGRKDDVLDLLAGRIRRTIGFHIDHDHSPVLG